MESRNEPIIIGGCPRSGTSLLRRILNAHSRIYCGPEVKFLRDLHGDYFRDPLRHGRFIPSARSVVPEEELLEVLGAAFVTLHERAAARAGKVRWADKNPENVLYLKDWQCLLGDRWTFLHIVRHPLDTLASIKEANFPFALPAGLDGRIGYYWQCLDCGLRFGEAHPGRYQRVCYEELAGAPRAIVKKLMQGLREDFEPIQLAFNEVPHQPGLEDPKIASTTAVHAHSIGRWPAILTSVEAETIWKRLLPLWRQVDPEAPDRPYPPEGHELISVSGEN